MAGFALIFVFGAGLLLFICSRRHNIIEEEKFKDRSLVKDTVLFCDDTCHYIS